MLTRPSLSVRSSTKALTLFRQTSVIRWFSSTSTNTPYRHTRRHFSHALGSAQHPPTHPTDTRMFTSIMRWVQLSVHQHTLQTHTWTLQSCAGFSSTSTNTPCRHTYRQASQYDLAIHLNSSARDIMCLLFGSGFSCPAVAVLLVHATSRDSHNQAFAKETLHR